MEEPGEASAHAPDVGDRVGGVQEQGEGVDQVEAAGGEEGKGQQGRERREACVGAYPITWSGPAFRWSLPPALPPALPPPSLLPPLT